jgi:hypothetical protein
LKAFVYPPEKGVDQGRVDPEETSEEGNNNIADGKMTSTEILVCIRYDCDGVQEATAANSKRQDKGGVEMRKTYPRDVQHYD